jgi:HlyD family secretion protein
MNTEAIKLEQAKRDFQLLRDFQLPRDEAELVAGLAEAERELDRVKLQAAALLVDFEAALETGQAKLDLEEDELADVVDQTEKAKIYAPRVGMVVYAKQPGGRYGRDDPIAEGTQVRERQDLITIPSDEGMVAEVSLHESVLKQVEVGQTCIVRVDAVPDSEFRGHVSFVALLPDQQSWFANPNQRLYRTDVTIDGSSPEMRPGMSCSIEILVEDIEDTVYTPVQSLFRHDGGNVAFVSDAGRIETRAVEAGRYNDRWVQVLDGLSEGEVVLLSPPTGFTLKPAGEEESEITAGSSPHSGGAPGASDAKGKEGGGSGKGGPPTAKAEGGQPGGPPADQRGQGGRPSAEQMEAFRAKMKAEGREMPSQEQIDKWRKQREGGGGGGSPSGAAAPSGS